MLRGTTQEWEPDDVIGGPLATVIDCRALEHPDDADERYKAAIKSYGQLIEEGPSGGCRMYGAMKSSTQGFRLIYPRDDGIRIETAHLRRVNGVFLSCAERHGWVIVAPYGANRATAGAM
jgi:hypothetical protein